MLNVKTKFEVDGCEVTKPQFLRMQRLFTPAPADFKTYEIRKRGEKINDYLYLITYSIITNGK